jgi:aminoglycoside phosphotransferase family enzyme
MAESDDFLDRRFEQQANLMVDLRVAQTMTDKQISELSKSIAEFRANANEVFGPILLNHEARMKKYDEQMERQQERMSKHDEDMKAMQQSIDIHTKNIEDLYRSQGHLLRRLFGEDLGTDAPA